MTKSFDVIIPSTCLADTSYTGRRWGWRDSNPQWLNRPGYDRVPDPVPASAPESTAGRRGFSPGRPANERFHRNLLAALGILHDGIREHEARAGRTHSSKPRGLRRRIPTMGLPTHDGSTLRAVFESVK